MSGEGWDHCAVTDYGFEWGPMTVLRIARVEGRGAVISVRTDHTDIQVLVSEKGRKIRVWRGNQELKEADGER